MEFRKKLQGRADISLNKTGVEQAYEAKEKLKNIKFDKVFCSPLKRAKQTCEIITDHEIIFDERIIERAFGEYEGVKKGFEFFWDTNIKQKFLTVESISDIEDRVFSFLDEITIKYPAENILIVCHGGVGLVISSYFYGKPKDGNYLQYLSSNGEILNFDNEKIK